MTALLSRPISDAFAQASATGKFYSDAEIPVIRTFEKREQPPIGIPGESCKTNLFFGFFFDGTKNNYRLAETSKSHSNVARLYDCYPGLSVPGVLPASTDWQHNPSRYTHFFKVYVPGVASPFPQVNDSGEGWQLTRGAATGALGEQRIIWALLQAINNIHRYFLKTPLVQPSETENLLNRIILSKHARRLMEEGDWQNAPVPNKEINGHARREFEKLLSRLHSAISRHWPDPKTGRPSKVDPAIVKKIYVSIFGFSRGATQARAFTNWLHSLCRLDARLRGKTGTMSLGGFEIQFDFLGLFDTVASVGLGNTLGNSIAGRLLDGHGAWADAEDSLRVPSGVKCLHLVAAHEIRRSFPVDSISVKGQLADTCEEIVVPGVHSDVGCGYCPGEQGRGRAADGSDMLARIPLLMMYKTARLNGVPLKLELTNAPAQARFALSPEAIKAFNAYIATCRETSGPIHRIMREQARKHIEWRVFRRIHGKTPIQATDSFLRASTFDQNDLYSATQEFEDEISAFVSWLKEKGGQFRPATQPAGFHNEHYAEWEEIATWWESAPLPCAAVLELFDNYVHDSRAWFKLIPPNPDNEKDAHALLASWIQRRKAVRAHNEMRPQMKGRGNSLYQMQATDGLSEDELRAVAEYEKTGKLPRMATRGREPFDSTWASWGLSGRAGYLRFRKIYGGWDAELLS
jgi:hypothetical protein